MKLWSERGPCFQEIGISQRKSYIQFLKCSYRRSLYLLYSSCLSYKRSYCLDWINDWLDCLHPSTPLLLSISFHLFFLKPMTPNAWSFKCVGRLFQWTYLSYLDDIITTIYPHSIIVPSSPTWISDLDHLIKISTI